MAKLLGVVSIEKHQEYVRSHRQTEEGICDQEPLDHETLELAETGRGFRILWQDCNRHQSRDVRQDIPECREEYQTVNWFSEEGKTHESSNDDC